MATYDNSYQIKINPATPNLRGLTTNYSNDGQKNLKGIGLGDLFELDYDRDKIEQIFNQGTDAQYALMQKENQIAQNQYANNQFANQQSAIDTLRQQRNQQIASGMARGLNAAQEQGTILGVQQDAMSGALELANARQTEADRIAAEYAQNVIDALKEANSVKEAIANVSAQLYEADMLGYTGELSAAAQMDANQVNKYVGEYTADKGLEGTKYSADKNLEGTKYNADRNLEGTKYAADQSLKGAQAQANATIQAARTQANATIQAARETASKYASGGSGSGSVDTKGIDYAELVQKHTNSDGTVNWDKVKGDLIGNNISSADADKLVSETRHAAVLYSSTQQEGIKSISSTSLWEKALDGNNEALKSLGVTIFGQMKSQVNDDDVKVAVAEAKRQINSGEYTFVDNQTLMDDLKKHKFGYLRLGW